MKNKAIILLIFAILLAACASSSAPEYARSQSPPALEESSESLVAYSSADMDAAPPQAALNKVVVNADAAGESAATSNLNSQNERPRSQSTLNRKIIYNATIHLRVEDPRATAKSLQALAARYGGYVSSANIYQTRDDIYQGMVQLRVDAEQFEAALEALRTLSTEVLNEQRDSQDVTDQYVDLTARIENLTRTEKELQELLTEAREKSRKVEDVLSVYRELTTIREQIELYQGQLNLLSDAVGLATIDIQLVPPEVEVEIVDEAWNPMRTVRSSIRNLTEGGQVLVEFSIIFVLNIVPGLLLIALIAFAFLRLWSWLRGWRTRITRQSSESSAPLAPTAPDVSDE